MWESFISWLLIYFCNNTLQELTLMFAEIIVPNLEIYRTVSSRHVTGKNVLWGKACLYNQSPYFFHLEGTAPVSPAGTCLVSSLEKFSQLVFIENQPPC